MTKSHWLTLRRGDLVRHKDHPHHIHTVLAASGDDETHAILTTITGVASDPDEWLQVNEDGQTLREDGTVAADIPDVCLMCRGNRLVPKPGEENVVVDCPRCKGDGAEPASIDESIIEIRIFYPHGPDEFPQMILSARTKYQPAQMAEMLERAVKIFREGLPPEEQLMTRHSTGLVN